MGGGGRGGGGRRRGNLDCVKRALQYYIIMVIYVFSEAFLNLALYSQNAHVCGSLSLSLSLSLSAYL